MARAIVVKYCGATETLPARWKVHTHGMKAKYYPVDVGIYRIHGHTTTINRMLVRAENAAYAYAHEVAGFDWWLSMDATWAEVDDKTTVVICGPK